MPDADIAAAPVPVDPLPDPDVEATIREFVDYTEYLPSDVHRYLWRMRSLHARHDDSRAELDEHLKAFARVTAPPNARATAKTASGEPSNGIPVSALTNGVNGFQRVMDSVSDKEMELRLLISQCLNGATQQVKEGAIEAARLEEHVERHHGRIVAIRDKLGDITIPSRDPTPEERPPRLRPEDSRVRITLRLGGADSSSLPARGPLSTSRRRMGRPRGRGRTPARRPPVRAARDEYNEEDDDGWEDVLQTPMRPEKLKKPRKTPGTTKRGPKTPAADPLLSGGAPSKYPDGQPIPENLLPWNQLTNEELARLRKRMKKNSSWTPSVTMIVRELEALGRGPNNKEKFRDQWEGKPGTYIGPEDGGIGDMPDDAGGRENKGMRLNKAKKRKREEEKKEREREAEEAGIDPAENEKRFMEKEAERHKQESQAKRKKKKEEEEAAAAAAAAAAVAAAKLAKEEAERQAAAAAEAEKAAREKEERERAAAEAEAKAKAEAEAAAAAERAAKEKADREKAERLAAEKAAKEREEAEKRERAAKERAAAEAKAKAEAAAIEAAAADESDLSDVPEDLDEEPRASTTAGEVPTPKTIRASKRNSARPPSRQPSTRNTRQSSDVPTITPLATRSKRGGSPAVTGRTTRRSTSVTDRSATPATGRTTKSTGSARGRGRGRSRGRGGRGAGRSRGSVAADTTAGGDDDQDEEDLNKYCLCDEVSRGTMVACENDDCPKVWFHISCVGLSKEEAESEDFKWYCPICEDNMQGRKSKRRRKN